MIKKPTTKDYNLWKNVSNTSVQGWDDLNDSNVLKFEEHANKTVPNYNANSIMQPITPGKIWCILPLFASVNSV